MSLYTLRGNISEIERSRKNLYGCLHYLPLDAIRRGAGPIHPYAYDYMNIFSRCLTRIFHLNCKAYAVPLINKCTGVNYGKVWAYLSNPNFTRDLYGIISGFDGPSGLSNPNYA
jgi:hypothetical protein